MKAIAPRFLSIVYRVVDLEKESSALDSRVIEYSFVLSNLLKSAKGRVLDVGCADSGNIVPSLLTLLDWDVWGIDVRASKFNHPNFNFVQCDIRNTKFPAEFFKYICAVSTLEHIGLQGRYSLAEGDSEGDLKAIKEIARIISTEGKLFLTLPYGKGYILKPLERIYNREMLQRLVDHYFRIEEEYYCVLSDRGLWTDISEKSAATKDWLKGDRVTALLTLVRRKP